MGTLARTHTIIAVVHPYKGQTFGITQQACNSCYVIPCMGYFWRARVFADANSHIPLIWFQKQIKLCL